jgi:DNA-binding NarL/FixJ family response regulator
MSAHYFIAPLEVRSPRWADAFPAAVLSESMPAHSNAGDYVWVLLDAKLRLNEISSLSAQGVKVIAMTALEDPAEAQAALAVGAAGYIHYLAAPSVLVQVVQVLNAGGLWLGAELMRKLVLATAKILPNKRDQLETIDISMLTPRELAVAELVAQGKTNKEVARQLDITERTVKAHLGASFEKLKVRDRLHLALVLSAQKSH